MLLGSWGGKKKKEKDYSVSAYNTLNLKRSFVLFFFFLIVIVNIVLINNLSCQEVSEHSSTVGDAAIPMHA